MASHFFYMSTRFARKRKKSQRGNTLAEDTPAGAAGAAGPGPATEQAPVKAIGVTWRILEKGIMTSPSFTITITARQTIRVADRDVELEMDRRGLSIKTNSEELIIDPRYNVAELRRGDKLVAISNKVVYKGEVYEAKDFAELVKRKVKELIEEAAATVGL
jgi:hypothetical protein